MFNIIIYIFSFGCGLIIGLILWILNILKTLTKVRTDYSAYITKTKQWQKFNDFVETKYAKLNKELKNEVEK